MSCYSHASFQNTEHDLTENCNTVYQTACRQSSCITPQNSCPDAACCQPIPATPQRSREYRLCTDSDGCAAHYPTECRNLFWPDFSHPRWLPCRCLYCAGNRSSNHGKH